MSPSARSPERILERLEWTVLRRLDGLLQGYYRTLFRGFGLDLADLREYQYHDDVRYIDWNVTARLSTPYVREYHEDREVTAWFLLDLSPSVDFGSRDVKKRTVSIDFVTVIARLLTRHGNRVGAIFYGERMDNVIAARSGRRHVLHILSRMLARPELPRSAATNLEDFLRAASDIVKRRSLVFVVSDFISAPGWAKPLSHFARRHEVVAIRLYDPLERELPDLGLFVIQDAETGEQPRSRLSQALCRGGGATRDRAPHGVPAGRRRCARAVDRRRSGRCDPALLRFAQAAEPARRGRQAAAAFDEPGTLTRACSTP